MSGSSTQALDYLERQSGVVQKRLYQQPSTALAVFRRMLPHMAKTIVMAMLYMPAPFPAEDLDLWIRPDSRAEKEQALTVLESLHIVSIVQETPRARAYRLSTVFCRSLRQALTGGGDHRSFGVPCSTPDKANITVEYLDEFARTQWEAILYYMVGSTGSGLRGDVEISHGTKTLLEIGRFVEVKPGRAVAITQAGFTFLLQEANAQVWSLLIVYLDNAADLQMDPVDVLSFLFMLGSLEFGQDYSIATLTATQKQMLEDLADFGIVYRRDPSSDRFYPTRLATTLTSDPSALQNANSQFQDRLGQSGTGKGYIIIETNYRLYAYTSSLLQIAVLNLFSRLTSRFPNLVSGKLTKESVQRAISYGITADQIISYLATYAHPQMQKSNPILPPTVVDQIRLWQIEGDRMKTTPGYLMKEFNTHADYVDLLSYAESLGVLVWKNDSKRSFFVNRIDQISQYLKNKNPKAG